jgi:YHS domain-containing protein
MGVLLRVFLFAVMALLLLRAVGRFLGGLAQGATSAPPPHARTETPVKMVKDPVCGTFVVPGKALSATAGGGTVWFCSEACRDQFARRG